MFKEMRRKEKQMTDANVITLLKEGDYGVVSSIGENGYPYGVPVNYVYENNKIYFHSATTGHKVSNFEADNKVSFCVVTRSTLLPSVFSTSFKSAIAFGKVEEVTDEGERQRVYELIIKELCSDYIPEGMKYIEEAGGSAKVYAINIEHLTGKESK